MTTNVTDAEADRIDEFLGKGTYDTWHEFDLEADSQLARRKKADAVVRKLDNLLYMELSPYGTDWVEKLQYDCAAAINLIRQKKYFDPAPFRQLLQIFPAALDASDLMLDNALNNLPTVWLVAGAAATPVAGFASFAEELQKDLLELDELLSEAEAEAVEVEIKAVIGIAMTTVELLVPGFGTLAKVGMTAAEAYLAEWTTTSAKTKYATLGLESLEHVERLSHKIRHVAGRGGKVLTVTGYYFDVEEVLDAKSKVKEIKALLDKTTKEIKENERRITEAVLGYKRLHHKLATSVAATRRAVNEKTDKRDALIKQYAYSLTKAIDWKAYDFSKVGMD